MFKYVTDVSKLSQDIIKNYCLNFNDAIDATLGNGHDTDFLSGLFNKVYSFDIQKCAVDNYSLKCPSNVTLVNDSHHKFSEYINGTVDCVMYNLGFMPGGDKSITTQTETSLESLKTSFDILNPGGIISIAIYIGHSEGSKEKDAILELLKNLPKNKYAVMLHTFINRKNNPPMLAIVEKK